MNGRFCPLSVKKPSSSISTSFTCNFILIEQGLDQIMQTVSLLNIKQTAQNLTRTIRDSMHLLDEYAPLQKQAAFHPSKGIARKSAPRVSRQSREKAKGQKAATTKSPSMPKEARLSRRCRETATGTKGPTNHVLHSAPQSEDVVVAGSEG